MNKRDWAKDWEMLVRVCGTQPSLDDDFLKQIGEILLSLHYWLQRVRELEDAVEHLRLYIDEALHPENDRLRKQVRKLKTKIEELRHDRTLEKQMRKRQDNRCTELEEQLAVWKMVALRLHQQLLYESRKFYFTVPADLDELAKEIERYLDEVSIEQFEEDLRKAGIEKCPDVEEKDKD